MKHTTLLWLGLAVLSAAPMAQAQIQQFYTTDAASDRLKIVDTAGSVSDVGALGFDTVNMDLAWHKGVLYGLDGANLYTISATGAATFVTSISYAGSAIPGEALASDGANLYAACGYGNLSSTWGTVDLTSGSTLGTLSPVGQFASDCDGAGYDGSQFWGIDLFVNGDNQNNYFYMGYPTPNTFAHAHNAYPGFTTLDENDIVASIGGVLYAVTSSGYLTEYSQASGSNLSTVSLSVTGNYRGLETVPEPGSMVFGMAGVASFALRRRLRPRKG